MFWTLMILLYTLIAISPRGCEMALLFQICPTNWPAPQKVIHNEVSKKYIMDQRRQQWADTSIRRKRSSTSCEKQRCCRRRGCRREEVMRQLGVSDATYYKWRKEYGGLRINQSKRLKELEQENGRLRKVVADLTIDNSILKEAARGNFWARQKRAGQSKKFKRK